MQTNQTFRELLEETRILYQKIGQVYCPALKANVVFGSEGFNHLRYKGPHMGRSKPEQRNKLSHVANAVDIIGTTTTIQEYRESVQVLGTADGNGQRSPIKVGYFGFWSVLSLKTKIRVKCIVRHVEGSGVYSFWSVMPDWSQKLVNGQVVRYVASSSIENE